MGRKWSGAAAAAPSLVSEGFSQHPVVVDRSSQQAPAPGHTGHGCCQDGERRWSRTLLGIGDPRDGQLRAAVVALRCRSWRCVCCKWRLRSRNRARAIKGATVPGTVVRFVTLTIDPNGALWREFVARESVPGYGELAAREVRGRLLTGDLARARLSVQFAGQAWNRLRLSLEREFGERLSYYRAVELHQSGMAHVHLLIRASSLADWFIHYRRLRELVVRAGFGKVLDVQAVKNRDAAASYVSKMTAAYTAKGAADAMPRWTRRGTWSRDWCEWTPATRLPGYTWQLAAAGHEFVRQALLGEGWHVDSPARVTPGSGGRWGPVGGSA